MYNVLAEITFRELPEASLAFNEDQELDPNEVRGSRGLSSLS